MSLDARSNLGVPFIMFERAREIGAREPRESLEILLVFLVSSRAQVSLFFKLACRLDGLLGSSRIPPLRGMRDKSKEPLHRRHSLSRTNQKGTAYSLTPIVQDSRIDESSLCYFFAFPDLEQVIISCFVDVSGLV